MEEQGVLQRITRMITEDEIVLKYFFHLQQSNNSENSHFDDITNMFPSPPEHSTPLTSPSLLIPHIPSIYVHSDSDSECIILGEENLEVVNLQAPAPRSIEESFLPRIRRKWIVYYTITHDVAPLTTFSLHNHIIHNLTLLFYIIEYQYFKIYNLMPYLPNLDYCLGHSHILCIIFYIYIYIYSTFYILHSI